MAEEAKATKPKEEMSDGCAFKGKTFSNQEEYHDGCESLCKCRNGEMQCLKLECPTYFGVDVLGECECGAKEFLTSPKSSRSRLHRLGDNSNGL